MTKRVLALGLDPVFADFSQMPGLTPELVRSYIDAQVERVRSLGYTVRSCLVDLGETAAFQVEAMLDEEEFDCVLFGAGLRAAPQLLLFESLLNLVHARAPGAKLCFNTTPADTAEAVQRWV
jgi:hypothetical protein